MIDGRPVVLVTGASGFIGRHLAPALVNQGWLVRRAVRRASSADDTVLIQSIDGGTDWTAALRDVDAVVHLAARVHHPESDQENHLYQSVNRDGTLQLARSAARAGVMHFVYMSTILVNGSRTDEHGPFRETDAPSPKGPYPISKAEAELGLAAIAKSSSLSVTILRPPLVYGPSVLGNFRRLLAAIRIGLPLPFLAIQNRRAFVAIDNLISFIVRRLGHPEETLEVFLIADDEQVSTPEFARRIAKACGGRARLFPLPRKALDLFFKITGRPQFGDSLLGSMEIDTSKARSTGWRPIIGLDDGLEFAVRGSKRRT
ncbi:NAD-dependent epimerase/dehydratase family protein [Bradyrhizobium sp. CCBAU 53338]|uniref:NAD-dependent epimerase/dehydratase family protein n=1 Tax=Bradyrhizobium sp. CCBAU 53338 TaxID=1325111 RepID=UPI00188A2AD9|nr:NAD-dependent epimerase/dehydratase family protein [Bradyrhizobium sp. CCBAU 53338]QOZ52015.1 UDP-glucose 4-epimerase [Bradyrhizobium sp. CCBAU 53338]